MNYFLVSNLIKTFRESINSKDEKDNHSLEFNSKSESNSESPNKLTNSICVYQKNNSSFNEKIKRDNIDYINRKTREIIENNKNKCNSCDKCDSCDKYNSCDKCKNNIICYEKDNTINTIYDDDYTINNYNVGLFFGGFTIGIGITIFLFYGNLNFKSNK